MDGCNGVSNVAKQRILGVVLAGGAGRRLEPLTADRAKSAFPFGGLYRVVDFALSNLVNGGVRRIWVLTQYKSHSLNRHITTTWRLSTLLDDWTRTSSWRRAPRSEWTRSMTGPVAWSCPVAASPWSARDKS
jgi:ADP-glucose pyrophosphorylase